MKKELQEEYYSEEEIRELGAEELVEWFIYSVNKTGIYFDGIKLRQ